MRAEFLFADFVAEHNIPFLVSDCFTRLCKAMFTNSKIASKFACGSTKTRQINKRSLAPSLHQEVVEHLQSNPFSIAIDESNERNCDKSLAILKCVTSPTSPETASLPCLSATLALHQTSSTICSKCSWTTTSHGQTWSPLCWTTAVL